jgi:hypothetical protein
MRNGRFVIALSVLAVALVLPQAVAKDLKISCT